MGNGSAGADLQNQLNILFRFGVVGDLSDGQLVQRFLTARDGADQAAFTALVERHGPVVLKVCRDVLGDPDDAADAFQATFLVLVRRAGSIRNRESVASWLYGVALRVAGSARSALDGSPSIGAGSPSDEADSAASGTSPSVFSPPDSK